MSAGGIKASRRAVLAGGGALLAMPAWGATAMPQVGRYRGAGEAGVWAFRGIRYARAARFSRPVIEPFEGPPVAADRFGPICPQRGLAGEPQAEDCLFLNVWTPEAHPRAGRPVMVYFHGGAYTTGSVTDPLTQGAHLASGGDVVVVTVNHRLNALGYLWLQPYGAAWADSGNLGQLDLVCALAWVRRHIAAFGGDPSRITVFGQSGGGAKIATLMAMPAARGTFHRAATMSGQQVVASGPAHALARTRAYFAALKLAEGDMAGLLALPVERLVEGLGASDPIMGGPLYFGPVLDMTNLPRHPFWPDAAPQSLAIPMILGNVKDETRNFLNPRGPKVTGLDWANLPARMAAEVKVDLPPDAVIAQYRAHYPGWTPQQIYYAATTAGRSWPGQVIEADARAAAGAQATWVYRLDRPSPIDPLRGAAHTDDIPYVFGTLDAPGSFSGTDAGARATRDALQGAFAKLAHRGDPGWTPYRLPERATLLVDDKPRVENDPRDWERQLWATAPYVQPGS